MNIAYISVVNPQDNDIIYSNFLYYHNLGIKYFYFMLHKPDDILKNIILKIMESEAHIQIFYNLTDEHWHEKDCKVLTDKAIADGMDWIVGTDADEILVLKKHKSIEEFLSEFAFNYGSLHFNWFEYKPLCDVYENAFVNMKNRDHIPRMQTKSIGKFNNKMSYVPGLHYIAESPEVITISPDVAFYAHFSDRNEKQYIDKMTLQAKNWSQRYGKYSHWAEKMIEDDPDGLKKLWDLQINQNLNKDLLFDPIQKEMFI
jgi:hypothetical protein